MKWNIKYIIEIINWRLRIIIIKNWNNKMKNENNNNWNNKIKNKNNRKIMKRKNENNNEIKKE